MKKFFLTFFTFLILATFVGCSVKTYNPVISTEFSTNAVYITGDFSFFCKIVKTKDNLTITPTTTNASGMSITYDGKNVTFEQGSLKKSVNGANVDVTNPSIILYEVFNYIDVSTAKRVGNTFQYTGKTSVGNFVLVQNDDNSFKSLTIPNANIKITFQK